MPEDTEELALSLNGFQKKLLAMDFMEAMEVTGVSEQVAKRLLYRFRTLKDKWFTCIDASFITEQQKEKYKELISRRLAILEKL
jgi:serine/threonine-protein kinase HipA